MNETKEKEKDKIREKRLTKKHKVIILSSVLSATIIFSVVAFYYTSVYQYQDLDTDVTVIAEGNLEDFKEEELENIGTIQLVKKDDGSYAVYFLDVKLENGPSLYVYISEKNSYSSSKDTLGDYENLGKLKHLEGTFEVEVDKTDNIKDYDSVLIWCEDHSVIMSFATIK